MSVSVPSLANIVLKDHGLGRAPGAHKTSPPPACYPQTHGPRASATGLRVAPSGQRLRGEAADARGKGAKPRPGSSTALGLPLEHTALLRNSRHEPAGNRGALSPLHCTPPPELEPGASRGFPRPHTPSREKSKGPPHRLGGADPAPPRPAHSVLSDNQKAGSLGRESRQKFWT